MSEPKVKIELPFDRKKANKLWRDRLRELETTGDVKVGSGYRFDLRTSFFHFKYSYQDKVNYIKKMIEKTNYYES